MSLEKLGFVEAVWERCSGNIHDRNYGNIYICNGGNTYEWRLGESCLVEEGSV